MIMVKKQFIAGAKCPRCNGMDKIRACKSAEREWMECVACGYEEERPTEGAPPAESSSADGVVVEGAAVEGAVKWAGKQTP